MYVLVDYSITVRNIYLSNAATCFGYLLKAFSSSSGYPTLQCDKVTRETRIDAGMAN